jgi:hypothetical protein
MLNNVLAQEASHGSKLQKDVWLFWFLFPESHTPMRLEFAQSFKKRAMGDGTHGLFVLGPSELFGLALSFLPPAAWARKEWKE